MTRRRVFWAFVVVSVSAGPVHAQSPLLSTRQPAATPAPPAAAPALAAAGPALPTVIPLTVPDATPLQIALDTEVRIRKVGQPIQGRIVQPVYVFDHLVIPVGTLAIGRIAQIEPISGGKRTLAFLNADFTPAHTIDVEFDQLVFADGRRLALHSTVAPGSGQVIHLATAVDTQKKNAVQDAASQKIAQAKQQWHTAMNQIEQPGKMHRLVRYGVAQLPAHPHYIEAGTLYSATLDRPLTFGSETLSASAASSIGVSPPAGSLVHALLLTPLDSATTRKGSEVDAVLSQPLFDPARKDHLILPQGTHLRGIVLQVKPAHKLHHNGQLRFAFREMVLPGGTPQRVDGSLAGVQSAATDNLKLDQEGGAKATDSKTRYLSTGVTLAFAAAGAHHDDGDHGGHGDSGGSSVAGGAAGFKLVGIVLGAAVQSQAFGIASGIYGSSRSVYTNFLGRGRDIVFPKNTAMDVTFSGRTAMPISPQQGSQ